LFLLFFLHPQTLFNHILVIDDDNSRRPFSSKKFLIKIWAVPGGSFSTFQGNPYEDIGVGMGRIRQKVTSLAAIYGNQPEFHCKNFKKSCPVTRVTKVVVQQKFKKKKMRENAVYSEGLDDYGRPR